MSAHVLTITGADDFVAPRALVELSERYPFVEWGILYSSKRCGTARYPSRDWLQLLANETLRVPLRLSLHLCGQSSRDMMEHGQQPMVPGEFQRIQLNGYHPDIPYVESVLRKAWSMFGYEYILQVRNNDYLRAASKQAEVCHGSVLFDQSGGMGIAPSGWPKLPRCKAGVAGGLTRDSAWYEYTRARKLGAAWVDMETGARTDDRFDLSKVREVLESFKHGLETPT